MQTKTVVKVLQDYDAENPNEMGQVLRLHSFSNRHVDFTHPREIFGCAECGYNEEDHGDDEDHVFDAPYRVTFGLSYYEHGLCKWMVGSSTVPDPGGFDTVPFAGVLTVNEEYEDHWESLNEDERLKVAQLTVEEYTNWANGETYGFTIERVTEHEGDCPTCDRPWEDEVELVDTCFGFIGSEGLLSEIESIIVYNARANWDGDTSYEITWPYDSKPEKRAA